MFSCCVVYVRAQVQLFPHSSANCHRLVVMSFVKTKVVTSLGGKAVSPLCTFR